MTTPHKAELALLGLLMLGMVWAATAWHEERVARETLDATLKTEKAGHAELKQQSAELVQDLRTRLDALEHAKAATVTPSQIIKEIPIYLPQNLPAPIAPVVEAPAAGAGPNTPPVVTGVNVPAVDLKPLFDELVECRECDAKLTAANQQEELDQQQAASLVAERDAAIKAAKGGSLWQRVKRHAEIIAISAASGYLLAKIAK
jgi:hypothetical protein